MKKLLAITLFLLAFWDTNHAQNNTAPSTIALSRTGGWVEELGFCKSWYCVAEKDDGTVAHVGVYDTGDTIVNGRTYAKLESWNGAPVKLLERQNGQKVYRYDEDSQEEMLVVDFSLDVDDVVTIGDYTWQVTETGTFPEYTKYYWLQNSKMLRLVSTGITPLQEDVWIEGVGSVKTGVLPRGFMAGVRNWYVVNVLDFSMNVGFDIDAQSFKARHLEIFDMTEEETSLWLDRRRETGESEWLEYSFVDDTLCVSGVLELNCYDYQITCEIEADHITIGINELDLLNMADCRSPHRVNARISGFTPGVYQVTYNGKTVAPTAITSVKNGNTITPVLHDLTGRSLTTPPYRGMWIEDGVKRAR